ncbi:CehA/McbA family metallohydrolase [Tamlana flava]|uniref:CehA/McbA family metallohydrolase n=1 Tax=Tamlana flava TaxID=3158572 RepID=UPI00351B1A58
MNTIQLSKLVSCVVLQLCCISLQAQNARLSLRILDDTGKETAARVQIKDNENNFYIAEDALIAGGDCDMSDEGAQLTDIESILKLFNKKIANPYFNSSQFYSDGSSSITQLPETVYIMAFKGSEFIVSIDTVTLIPDSITTHTIQLSRWTNMRNRNWYSADDHLHIPRPIPEMNPHISKMMQAEDIHVGNLLQSGKVKNFKMAEQYAFGSESIYEENGYLLASGQENPRTHILGHSISLGAEKALFNLEKYMVYRLIWEESVEYGGLNGFAHAWSDEAAGPSPEVGMAIVLPHDLMHFIEVLQFNRSDYRSWYDVLNLGFKVTPTAGTDYPCADQSIPGHERFYTKVDGDFTFENWLKGIEKGKTFVTTGPVLDFQVNGQEMGSELELKVGDSISVSGWVKFDTSADNLNFIEIIENGRAIKKISRVSTTDSLGFEFLHAVKSSGWLALRGYGDKIQENLYPFPAHLDILKATTNFHSAPIYLDILSKQNPETSATASSWLQRILDLKRMLEPQNLEFLAEKIMNPWHGVTEDVLLSSKETLIEDLDYAEQFFRGLIEGKE